MYWFTKMVTSNFVVRSKVSIYIQGKPSTYSNKNIRFMEDCIKNRVFCSGYWPTNLYELLIINSNLYVLLRIDYMPKINKLIKGLIGVFTF